MTTRKAREFDFDESRSTTISTSTTIAQTRSTTKTDFSVITTSDDFDDGDGDVGDHDDLRCPSTISTTAAATIFDADQQPRRPQFSTNFDVSDKMKTIC